MFVIERVSVVDESSIFTSGWTVFPLAVATSDHRRGTLSDLPTEERPPGWKTRAYASKPSGTISPTKA
jgi:hypothetical protein